MYNEIAHLKNLRKDESPKSPVILTFSRFMEEYRDYDKNSLYLPWQHLPVPNGRIFIEGHCKKRGIAADFEIASAATSREEIGNTVHYGTRNKLAQLGISVSGKHAVQVTKRDYEYYDLLLVMDSNNIRNLRKVIGEDTQDKVHLLLDYTERKGASIADPWYTGDFEVTYDDIMEGLDGLLKYLKY